MGMRNIYSQVTKKRPAICTRSLFRRGYFVLILGLTAVVFRHFLFPPKPAQQTEPSPHTDIIRCLQGSGCDVITPQDIKQYELARRLVNARFDRHPIAVTYPLHKFQVPIAQTCCVKHNVRCVARGGRHSYEGLSTEDDVVVIDLSKLTSIEVSRSTKTAIVEAGANFGQLYTDVWKETKGELTVTGGSCFSVGLIGYYLGGGLSPVSRHYGLGCDSVKELEVVLHDGNTVTASEKINQDLYWASCGAGGGNFPGIVVSMSLALHPSPANWTKFTAQVAKKDIPAFLTHWQEWIGGADSRLNTMLGMHSFQEELEVSALFVGDAKQLAGQIEKFGVMNHSTYALKKQHMVEMPWLHAIYSLIYPNFVFSDMSEEDLRNLMRQTSYIEDNDRLAAKYTSICAEAPISTEIVQALIQWRDAQHDGPFADVALLFDGLFGANSRLSAKEPTDTAFAQRKCVFSLQVMIWWHKETNSTTRQDSAVAALDKLKETLQPFGLLNSAFINYLDGDPTNAATRYYGPNVEKLKTIKQKYDPSNIYSNPYVNLLPPA